MKRLFASLCLLALLFHGSAALHAAVPVADMAVAGHCATPADDTPSVTVLQLCLQLCAMPMARADAAAVPIPGHSPMPAVHGLPGLFPVLVKRLFRPPITA